LAIWRSIQSEFTHFAAPEYLSAEPWPSDATLNQFTRKTKKAKWPFNHFASAIQIVSAPVAAIQTPEVVNLSQQRQNEL
jgi:hypothetical protein